MTQKSVASAYLIHQLFLAVRMIWDAELDSLPDSKRNPTMCVQDAEIFGMF